MTIPARRNNLRPRILLAPCGFKESLSVAELIESMARGVKAAAPEAEILRAPMADGGEGFAQTLVELTGGCLRPVQVTGPVGQPLEAHLGLLGGAHVGTVAIEIAAAAGLRHVPVGQRDPLWTTSYGVGELVREALDLGARRLLIGCGDSGVNDGGAGLAQALGIRLSDRRGRAIGRGCRALGDLAHVDLSGRDPRLSDVSIDVAVNWDNVLLGRRGVSRIFGPQKGALPKDLDTLENGLRILAEVFRRDLGIDVRSMQGAGASGGLGAGLHAFLGACLYPRFEILSRFLDFDALLERADLVLTAEGSIDGLTPFGKLPAEVARRANQAGIPVVAIVGSVADGADTVHEIGIDAYFSIVDRPCSMADAMSRAPELVARATEQVVRLALLDCQSTRNWQKK
ncbi:glycerate kinase [Variovorax paradoxus]|jgi:glycerate 2-kinase|uniref:Glycerate kinase n=1 Tax=Variovorax paradoxus TaxID=34073 RepID=A0A5Q0LZ93_VARPD|nr:glycerate kinase [Variovorax paradoxus]QFZ81917.1 glycerate kinase [Variovorax paradoxus]